MSMMRKLISAEISQLGDDEVEVVMSTASLARDGHVLVPRGCLIDNYLANPIVLWSHDSDKPIGNAENVTIGTDQIVARIRFAPLGISAKADEIRGLMKSGVIRAVSVGFDPVDMEPLDAKKPRGGQLITSWELLELSAVSVPADAGAMVTARSNGEKTMPELDGTEPTAKPIVTRDLSPGRVKIVFQRGLYQVAQLCYMFESLGYQVDSAKYEAAIEGDGSKVPAMLAGVLHDFGDAILAMTQEEVAEALAGHDVEPEDDAGDVVLLIEDRQHIAAATSPAIRAFRRGLAHAKVRAGKKLSTETMRSLREAKDFHEEAMALHRSAMRKHKDGMGAIDDLLSGAGAENEGDDAGARSADAGTVVILEADELPPGNGLSSAADFRRRQAELLEFATR